MSSHLGDNFKLTIGKDEIEAIIGCAATTMAALCDGVEKLRVDD